MNIQVQILSSRVKILNSCSFNVALLTRDPLGAYTCFQNNTYIHTCQFDIGFFIPIKKEENTSYNLERSGLKIMKSFVAGFRGNRKQVKRALSFVHELARERF